jgi:hypothetical protein
MKSKTFFTGLLLFTSISPAFAWHDSGHMVVAEIARQGLRSKVLAEADWLLKIDADPKSDSFLTAACWADDHKSKESAPWHYINIHFRTDDKSTDNKPEDQNIVAAITRFTQILSDKKRDPKDRAEALRYLIHFVGDIHQPLHAVARDSDEHPEGDRGGNEFKIIPPDRFKDLERPPTNLHSLWDMGGNLFRPTVRPLSDDGKASIVRIANSIKSRHPMISLDNVSQMDPMAWAQESADIAKRFAYTNIKEGEVPSAEYLRECEDQSAKRVAYAGYRLAALLNKAMG